MILINGKKYNPKYPINPENAEYNSAIIYYDNIEQEIKELKEQLDKHKNTIKRLAKED